jgi:hypothetical protein
MEGEAVTVRLRLAALVFMTVSILSSCSRTKPSEPLVHSVDSDGSSVPGAPEPEVVQLRNIDAIGGEKHVTVGNLAGDYVLVCNEEVNEKAKHPYPSCLSPRPRLNYLLFRANTKWLERGAKEPMTLSFMQDYTVSYNNSENIGLLPTGDRSADESFGVYWLLSWTAKAARN